MPPVSDSYKIDKKYWIGRIRMVAMRIVPFLNGLKSDKTIEKSGSP